MKRLAAYWVEALGGPSAYSASYGDETTVVKMHSGKGEYDEMDRRAIACFDQALADGGLADDGTLRQVLHDYFAWATTTIIPATTSPPMMCLTASASHIGHGTDSRGKTPRLACTAGSDPNFADLFREFVLTIVAEPPASLRGRSLLTE